MKKMFVFGVLALFFVGFAAAENNSSQDCAEEGEMISIMPTSTGEPGIRCCNGLTHGGSYTIINNICNPEMDVAVCINCPNSECGSGENKCNCPEDCDEENLDSTQKICCHIYGLGAYMKKVNGRYQWIKEEDCVIPEGFVGGGREIVEDKFCIAKKIIQARNRIKAYYNNQSECPEQCTCTGSVMKCGLENGGREMTVMAGKSGNTIVQVKNANMSTKVVLYKANNSLYGIFGDNQTREIKVLPDQVREKIRERIKARLQNETIELDEDGVYQVRVNKRARLFFLFPVREGVEMQINSETGEMIKTRTSWWGFLARDVKEDAGE